MRVGDLKIAPSGVAFVPPAVRPGILPRLLSEILDTRIMVRGPGWVCRHACHCQRIGACAMRGVVLRRLGTWCA